MNDIKNKIQALKKEIQKYPQKVELIIVTKHRSAEDIIKVLEAGITDIAENRIQEAETKFQDSRLRDQNLKKHLICHLQSNKVKKAVDIFDMIQSVDSEKILAKINQECTQINKIMPVLLQVNIFEDPLKYGFLAKDISAEFIKNISEKYQNIRIEGLMTIGAQGLSENETLLRFEKLAQLQKKVNLKTLSMGMSQDYPLALQAGANMIRVGSAIFT